MSNTPHASPPQKIARKALDEVEVEGTRLFPFCSGLQELKSYRRAMRKIVTGSMQVDHLRLSAKSAAKVIR